MHAFFRFIWVVSLIVLSSIFLGVFFGIYYPIVSIDWTEAKDCRAIQGTVLSNGMSMNQYGEFEDGKQYSRARIQYTLPSGVVEEGVACSSVYNELASGTSVFTGHQTQRYPYIMKGYKPAMWLCTGCSSANSGEECASMWNGTHAYLPTCQVADPSGHPGQTPFVLMGNSEPYLPPDYIAMWAVCMPLIGLCIIILLVDLFLTGCVKLKNGAFQSVVNSAFGVEHVPLWNVNTANGRIPKPFLMWTTTLRSWMATFLAVATPIILLSESGRLQSPSTVVIVIGWVASLVQHTVFVIACGPWSSYTKRSEKDWLARATVVPYSLALPVLPMSPAECVTLWLRHAAPLRRLAVYRFLVFAGALARLIEFGEAVESILVIASLAWLFLALVFGNDCFLCLTIPKERFVQAYRVPASGVPSHGVALTAGVAPAPTPNLPPAPHPAAVTPTATATAV